MSHGCTGTTQKQKHSRRNGSIPRPPCQKKERQVRSKTKVMLTLFFLYPWNCASWIRTGRTVTKEYYQQVPKRLRDAVRRKGQDLWTTKSWQFHHDNAPAHSSNLIKNLLTKYGIRVLNQLSLLSKHGSLRLLVVSEVEDTTETILFWE